MMYKVVSPSGTVERASLDEAMTYAKRLNQFVTITGPGFEVVGRFGVDEVANGKTPDGVDYTWVKRRQVVSKLPR